jgi:hypothetical protein
MQTQNNSRCDDLSKHAGVEERRAANQLLWKLVAGAGGIGLMGGAGMGLSKLLTEDKPYSPDPSFQSVDIVVPKKKKPLDALPKFAAAALTTKLAEGPSIITQFADAVDKHLPTGNNILGNFFGDDASSRWTVPALAGLGLPLATLAAYGGLKAGRGIVDWRRKAELDAKLQKTQDEYKNFVEQNLAHKHASAQVECALDELADLYEKDALWPISDPRQAAVDIKNVFAGPYTAYALLSALGAGKLSYDYFKKRSPEKIQEAALRQRALERYGGAKPIYLSPAEEQVA